MSADTEKPSMEQSYQQVMVNAARHGLLCRECGSEAPRRVDGLCFDCYKRERSACPLGGCA